jgi:hypothetical protein
MNCLQRLLAGTQAIILILLPDEPVVATGWDIVIQVKNVKNN